MLNYIASVFIYLYLNKQKQIQVKILTGTAIIQYMYMCLNVAYQIKKILVTTKLVSSSSVFSLIGK